MARVKSTRPTVTSHASTATTVGWERARASADLTLWLPGDVPIDFRLIQPGVFRMGSRGYYEYEEPMHAVRITRPFYLGIFPVTQGQWRALVEARPGLGLDPSPSLFGHSRRNTTDASECGGPDGGDGGPDGGHNDPVELRPVERVSWADAFLWCEALLDLAREPSSKARCRPALDVHSIDLPTEAEWEYACRAGSETEYCSGDGQGALDEVGWWMGNSDGRTHAVGGKSPNAWGLYDMHGNVFEWCRDWMDGEGYRRAERVDGVEDPEVVAEPSAGQARVARGGSWDGIARGARSAYRGALAPGSAWSRLGFRLRLRSVGSQPAERGSSTPAEQASRRPRSGRRPPGGRRA